MACMFPHQKTRLSRPSAFFPRAEEEDNSPQRTELESRESGGVVVQPFHFPPTKQIWWDRKPQGSSEILHLTSKRNLRLQLNEKTLRLGIKHLNKLASPYECFFIGSIFIDSREDAVEINIDRFDPGREFIDKQGGGKRKVPTTVVPGDQVIPLKLVKGLTGAEQSVVHSKQEFHRTFEVLHSRLASQEPLSLSNFLSVKACCYAHTEDDDMIINIQFGVVTMVTSILATPVNPVPIIPTALARNLTGPLRLSEVQGIPKCGYLTMDHTRKLLLLLESDPKAYSLPLIGVWVSGPFTVHHPYIWACCVRFLHCTAIKERALVSPNTFLLVHYSPAQTNPIFWECTPQDQMQTSLFDLYSSYENLHLDQVSTCNYPEPLCFDVLPPGDTMYSEVFEQASKSWAIRHTTSASHNHNDDEKKTNHEQATAGCLEPRPSPSPYPQVQQNKLLMPTVAEVSDLSLSFEEPSVTDNKPSKPGLPTVLPRDIRKILPERVEVLDAVQDQENRVPLSHVHRHTGKQAAMANSPQQSPQRQPLKPITGQHTNSSSGPKVSCPKHEAQVHGSRPPLTCTDKAPHKGMNRQGIAKRNSMTKFNGAKAPNGIRENKPARNLTQHENSTKEYVELMQHKNDFLTPKTKENHVNLVQFSDPLPDGKRNIFSEARQCGKEGECVMEQSELCDSGVGDSPKHASFPEEEEEEEHIESQPQPEHNDPNMKQLQQQLTDLQQQINLLLLQQSLAQNSPNGIPTPPPTPVTDTSNLSPLPRLGRVTVGTNTPSPHSTAVNSTVTIATSTGSSLLLTSPVRRGKVSVGTSPMNTATDSEDNVRLRERSPCTGSPNLSASSHITLDRPSPDQTINEALIMDKLDNTNETLASSLHAVDICEFSPESTGRGKQPRLDDSSPVLGESASMLMDQPADTPPQPEHHHHDSLLLRNEKLFYDNLLDKVNKLLSERVEEENAADSSRVSTGDDAKQVNGSAISLPTREQVVQATVQELDRLKGGHGDRNETIVDAKRHQSSNLQVNEIITGLPHLNYISMSMDESIADSVLATHSLYTAYLSTSELHDYQHLINDYCSTTHGRGQTITRVDSIRDSPNEVNCTWNNLSMATQDYLHRYNFTGRNTKESKDRSDCRDLSLKSVASVRCTAPPSTPEPTTDRILDIERLRNLPKLL